MTGGRGVVQTITCRDCPEVVLAIRYPSGNIFVVVPGSEWSDDRVVVHCPECHRRAKFRLTGREAA